MVSVRPQFIPALSAKLSSDVSISPDPRVLKIDGTGFSAEDSYLCLLEGKHMKVEIAATFVSETEINCSISKEEKIHCKQLPCFIQATLLMEAGVELSSQQPSRLKV